MSLVMSAREALIDLNESAEHEYGAEDCDES